jgi:hypothetical protein
MRRTIAILIVLLALSGIPGAFAQPNNPPLLVPAQPVIPPPPLVVPAPVPPANPMPPPLPSGYGTPPGISTTAPLRTTPRATYRSPEYRKPMKRPWKKRRRYESSIQ